jgi:deazaflavin-dependent oxidoreductase (nitroreductase family)
VTRHVVISGAGIAGPALAHQLTGRGWQTTVVERFPQRRDEGQNVDVRGAAREVVRRMGIEADVRAANTGEIGMRFLRDDGSTAAAFPMNADGETDGPTAEFEILRGELSRILIERTADRTDYRFGTQITDVTDYDGDRVTVALDDGTAIDADLAVIAEGLRSRSRRFVTSADVSELGMYFAYVTVARRDTDGQWWNWQHATESRAVHLRPDNLGTTRAILTFISDVRGLEDLAPADQIAILRRTFADVGGAAPRILAELDSAPLYFSAVGQVAASTWSKGRLVLLGDAAFCAATFGGSGTSLALIGAYVLAGELARTDDQRAALAGFERFMRPLVEAMPPVRMSVLRRANPRTRAGIRVLHSGARLMASPAGRAVTTTFGRRLVDVGLDGLRLPDYPAGGNTVATSEVDGRMTDHAELSPTEWVREQTERILSQGTTDGVEVLDRPIVLFTTTGAQSGKKRYVPLMRVEENGRYAMVASKGGDPKHPLWYFNVKANPSVTVQDGDKTATLTAREVDGAEREHWWKLAVEAYPPYAEYQTKTDRLIPVFVVE